MKVLGICCSPRVRGNTEIMLRATLDTAQAEGAEVELVALAKKTVAPCDACYSCRNTGECHIDDDMQEIYPKLLEADGIIFASPVYFWSVTAQAKALLDRTYALHFEKRLRNKVAGVVLAKARSGGTAALAVFDGYCNLQQMIVVGRAMGFGGREKGETKKDKLGLAQAEALGKIVVKYIETNKILFKIPV